MYPKKPRLIESCPKRLDCLVWSKGDVLSHNSKCLLGLQERNQVKASRALTM